MATPEASTARRPRPLSLDLLEPLKNRQEQTHLSAQEIHADPEPRYISALHRVLATDLAAGHLTTTDLTGVLAVVVDKMGSVRQAPGADNRWPMPGQSWATPADVDPRVSLVAWLIHNGADPWEADPMLEGIGVHQTSKAKTVATMLTYGHAGATHMALCLPQAVEQDFDQTFGSRWDYSTQQVKLTQMAAHTGATDVIDRLHEMGVDLDDALWHARDADTVQALLAHKARSEGKGGPSKMEIASYWSSVLPAVDARSMMTALAACDNPSDAVLRASKSNTWGPLKDAIDACPGWQDIKVKLSWGPEVRLPAYMIIKASSIRDEAKIAQALRLVGRAAIDDREIVPGLTEKSMVRLALATTAKNMSHRPKLAEKARSLLEVLSSPCGAEQALCFDGAAFAAAIPASPSLIKHECIVRLILQRGLATPGEFTSLTEDGTNDPQYVRRLAGKLASRSIDDLMAIARILHAAVMQPTIPNLGGFTQVFGLNSPGSYQTATANGLTTNGEWLDALWKKNANRRAEIAHAATVLTAFFVLQPSMEYANKAGISLQKWASRIENWIGQGVDPGISEEFATIFAERSSSNKDEAIRHLGQSMLSRLSSLRMHSSVLPVQDANRSGPRF